MSRVVDIDRLSIGLHGVSAQIAEAAVVGLDAELGRRLGDLVGRALATGDLGVVHIGPITGAAVLDAGALRGLIAERLVWAITTDAPPPPTAVPNAEED